MFYIRTNAFLHENWQKNYSSADGKYEVRLMTKAELKYTGGKIRRKITKYFFVKLSAKTQQCTEMEMRERYLSDCTLISLTLRRGDMEPARHLQVVLPNRRWMVPTKIFADFHKFSELYLLHILGEDFQAFPPRSTNFSWESFSGGTFFISWL